MAAPYRIRQPGVGVRGVARERGYSFDLYLGRLMKMIPGEAVGLYLVGIGFIPNDQAIALLGWAVICLLGVIAIKAYGTADPEQNLPADWTQVMISAMAFVIWVYTLGGPFAAFNIAVPYIGSLLVLAWTFFVPIFFTESTGQ